MESFVWRMEWFVWLDLFIRSAILLLAGEALRRLLSRTAAAHRHKFLLLVIAFLAILPIFSALAPSIHIPAWLFHAARGTVSIQTATFLSARAADTASSWLVANLLFLIWLSGASAMLTFVICGRLALWRTSRRAVTVHDPSWIALVKELTSRFGLQKAPVVLSLEGLATPLAFGIRQPTILLPGNCVEWSDLRKRVVLLHELAHVKRRDVAAQLFASAIAAMWWFQPLAWIVRRELRRQSEQACDAQAIGAGVRPCDYAAELIEIARTATLRALWSRAAIAMARPRDLEGRLVRILNPCSRLHARNRSAAAIAALSAVALTASAVTLSSKQRIPHLGGLPMKRTLISGLATSIGLSAATITGSVFDPIGAPVADAKVSLSEPDTSVKQETTSTANGKFSFDGLPSGQYILRIEKPGYAVLLREFTLRQSSNVERGFSMQLPPTQVDIQADGQGARAMPDTTDSKRVRVGGALMESKLVNKVNPVYPVSAKKAGIQGTVLLDATVLKDGTAGEINVLSSPNDDLSQASLDAVRQWRWSPTLLNGQPIEVITEVIINFTLAR